MYIHGEQHQNRHSVAAAWRTTEDLQLMIQNEDELADDEDDRADQCYGRVYDSLEELARV